MALLIGPLGSDLEYPENKHVTSSTERHGGMSKHKVLSVTAADCELQTFTSGGPGGQHQNRSQTGVRFIHRASGARGEARDERSQLQNKKLAWRRMAESKGFQL